MRYFSAGSQEYRIPFSLFLKMQRHILYILLVSAIYMQLKHVKGMDAHLLGGVIRGCRPSPHMAAGQFRVAWRGTRGKRVTGHSLPEKPGQPLGCQFSLQ